MQTTKIIGLVASLQLVLELYLRTDLKCLYLQPKYLYLNLVLLDTSLTSADNYYIVDSCPNVLFISGRRDLLL